MNTFVLNQHLDQAAALGPRGPGPSIQEKERSEECSVSRTDIIEHVHHVFRFSLKMSVCLSLCRSPLRLASLPVRVGKVKHESLFHGSLFALCVHVQTAGDPVTAPHVWSSGSLLNSGTFPQPGRCDEFFMLAQN